MSHGPLTFFDALVRLDAHHRFESFSPDEVVVLKRYRELCAEMAQTSFFQAPVRLSFKASPEESYERLEHAGDDQLRAMTMRFRQLWMQKEPTRFHAVLALLRRHVTSGAERDETIGLLDELGRRHRGARRTGLMKHVWADDPMGAPIRDFDAEQVIDDWFNGGQFHSDPDAMRRVRGWSSTSYEWSLIKAVRAITGVLWELDVLVGAALEADALLSTSPA